MMADKRQKIYLGILLGIKGITLLLMLFLTAGVMLVTSYVATMDAPVTLFKGNNLFLMVLSVLAHAALFGGMVWILARKVPSAEKIVLCGSLLWIAFWGVVLILFSKSVPSADAMTVYSAAESFARGDMSAIHPTESYFSYYPHQIGLAAFLEVLFRIWNMLGIDQHAYHFIKGIYVLLLCMAVYFQYKSCDRMWKNTKINMLFLLFAAANLPMIMYSSFIYGEIPSFTAFSAGFYVLYRFMDGGKHWYHAVLSALLLGLSVMLRKNTLILIIAVCLVLLVEAFREKSAAVLGVIAATVIASMGILPMVQSFYEYRADNYLNDGVTAWSYIAMGMQEGTGGCGFYNGFNFNTYQESGMCAEKANEVSRTAIRERMAYFAEHPGYTVAFYSEKCWAQWADATYDCRFVTSNTFGGRNAFFEAVYDGTLSMGFVRLSKGYQVTVFVFALVFCAAMLRRKGSAKELMLYIGLIGVLGGFLFHMMWEASSRYVFVYSLLLMPYAAWGLHEAIGKIFKKKMK